VNDLDGLLAIQSCRDLVLQAARATDLQDHAGFAALFADDGVLVRPGAEPLCGPEAIAASYRTRPADRITRHMISNSLITLHSASRAAGVSSVLLWSTKRSLPEGAFGRLADARQIVGEFEDELSLIHGAWRISSRIARFLIYRES
jgi:hypothetical protein